ncbi:endonuclease/exonuclease/phosphatase (EEP) superfamily protein YafD [Microbacterium resistens]|uniref:Endonuclease/exonuclease/phosphatase (EEP) superfamily protein YafD n=1 Tax=Microbacterium resistens TaxID=156977 RepID=A0ABU1S931_9MICO|nr:endonuclease/exonuclease/phosphatase family protein [Microbacterium resistens]MDR6866085.1 endonuclease/exonuclease/phosphatase (EEP) superfamily protein YafD [Microbacterium resistens]
MPERSRHRRAFAVTLIVGAPVAVLLVWPQAFGAQTMPGIAQAVAFRAGLAIALFVVAVLWAAIALIGRRRHVLSGIAAGLAVMLGAASIGNGATLFIRGAAGSTPEGELVVAAWNTLGGAASPESIARLVLESGADVVSLPETDAAATAEVVRLLSLEGREMAPGTVGSSIPTSVLISERLGEYRLDRDAGSTPGLPSAVWRPVDGTGPAIVTAHPLPPLPDSMAEWRTGLRWSVAQCDDPETIVAGDLNATVDHLSALLGGCRDAASEVGTAAVGTWPTSAPTWLSSPIDHVLVGSAWTVRGVEVLTSFDDAGSDHRPVVAVLESR